MRREGPANNLAIQKSLFCVPGVYHDFNYVVKTTSLQMFEQRIYLGRPSETLIQEQIEVKWNDSEILSGNTNSHAYWVFLDIWPVSHM